MSHKLYPENYTQPPTSIYPHTLYSFLNIYVNVVAGRYGVPECRYGSLGIVFFTPFSPETGGLDHAKSRLFHSTRP